MNEETKLLIQENICLLLQEFKLEIITHLGQFQDIHYYLVTIHNLNKSGLLRFGAPEGGLQRELNLRQHLGEHKMISPLLLNLTLESMENAPKISQTLPPPDKQSEEGSNYLEEEYYPEIELDTSTQKLLLLTEFPQEVESLKTWLSKHHSLDECLLIASQICQFFRFVYQYQICLINIVPEYIILTTPLTFYDLTHAYPQGEQLTYGFAGEYYPPELAYGNPISEQMSTYVVGCLLYQAIHQQLPSQDFNQPELQIKKIPKIYQILSLSLTPFPENRFILSQLLNLLVTSRKTIAVPQVSWQVASKTTLGLSSSRLENEDSYGIIHSTTHQGDSLILAVVADGMGGLAQGEVASQTAVKTVLKAHQPTDLTTPGRRSDWLNYLVETANEAITRNVPEGGTTISIVLAFKKELNIAHVGDSRIYLIRNNVICQLSEDHSMVAMLLANGQITYEESLNHSDRNLLLKSLGSKPRLSEGYVQELNRFGGDISLALENGDQIILCSDGVWDLVPPSEMLEVFNNTKTLQEGVNQTLDQVIEKGAHDNATIIALQCTIQECLSP